MPTKTGNQFHLCFEIDLIRTWRPHRTQASGEPLLDLGNNWLRAGKYIHRAPPIIWADCCTSENIGPGNQTASSRTGTAVSAIAVNFQPPSGARWLGCVGSPRQSFEMCARNPAKIVTTPAIKRNALHPLPPAS